MLKINGELAESGKASGCYPEVAVPAHRFKSYTLLCGDFSY